MQCIKVNEDTYCKLDLLFVIISQGKAFHQHPERLNVDFWFKGKFIDIPKIVFSDIFPVIIFNVSQVFKFILQKSTSL